MVVGEATLSSIVIGDSDDVFLGIDALGFGEDEFEILGGVLGESFCMGRRICSSGIMPGMTARTAARFQ